MRNWIIHIRKRGCVGAFMKYRRIFQMILVCITGILLSGCRGQIEEQKKKKQDTHQDSTIQIYKTVGNVSQGIESWWFKRNEEHQQPEVSQKIDLSKYDAYYVDPKCTEKKIYLTFDCGYENGNTSQILDALKKHDAPAAFFVVGHFLESAPEMVKRMVEDGHTVGNHTYHHYDMSKISDPAVFRKEMDDVRTLFQETTGTEMAMYYRPPQGKYSETNLQMAKDLGYSTFFWSLAYVDWNVDAQPSHEEAFSKLTGRIHPGAVVLLHNTSKTNGEILDELLTKWEEMGYTFGKLEELVQ